MAFSICITKKGRIDFEKLNQLSQNLDRDFVTVFPITKNSFTDEQGLGLSINLKNDYSGFWTELKPFLQQLSKMGYNIIELYNGENLKKDIDKLRDYLINS